MLREPLANALAGAAGTKGANLRKKVRAMTMFRLERFVGNGKTARMALAFAMLLAPCGPGITGLIQAHGQAPKAASPPPPSFEVVRIRESGKEDTRAAMGFNAGGKGFYTINATGRDLIQEAYGLKSTDQILGASGWVTTQHFDVDARIEDAEAERLQAMPMGEKIEQVRLMLQSMLRERLGLKLHESSREGWYFELVAAKSGPKLKPTAMAPADPEGVRAPHPVVGPVVQYKGPGKLQVTGAGISVLTEQLSRMPELGFQGGFTMGILVVDKTGLPGMYDWTLNWTPDNASAGEMEGANAPSLFAALNEQLGLKLVKAKGSMELLVIDHLDRPSEN